MIAASNTAMVPVLCLLVAMLISTAWFFYAVFVSGYQALRHQRTRTRR